MTWSYILNIDRGPHEYDGKNTYNMMFDGAGCRGCLISESSPDTWQRRWMLDGCGWGKINPCKTHGKPMGYPYFKKPA